MRFAGGDYSLGVFHRLARTGEGVEGGASFQMPWVLDQSEQLQCGIHFSPVGIPAFQVSHVNAEVPEHQMYLLSSETSIREEHISSDARWGSGV